MERALSRERRSRDRSRRSRSARRRSPSSETEVRVKTVGGRTVAKAAASDQTVREVIRPLLDQQGFVNYVLLHNRVQLTENEPLSTLAGSILTIVVRSVIAELVDPGSQQDSGFTTLFGRTYPGASQFFNGEGIHKFMTKIEDDRYTSTQVSHTFFRRFLVIRCALVNAPEYVMQPTRILARIKDTAPAGEWIDATVLEVQPEQRPTSSIYRDAPLRVWLLEYSNPIHFHLQRVTIENTTTWTSVGRILASEEHPLEMFVTVSEESARIFYDG